MKSYTGLMNTNSYIIYFVEVSSLYDNKWIIFGSFNKLEDAIEYYKLQKEEDKEENYKFRVSQYTQTGIPIGDEL